MVLKEQKAQKGKPLESVTAQTNQQTKSKLHI